MTIAERERYVRWWVEESGLTLVQLREVAGTMWAIEDTLSDAERSGLVRRGKRRQACRS
jgi:hypothetical protein